MKHYLLMDKRVTFVFIQEIGESFGVAPPQYKKRYQNLIIVHFAERTALS